jgi:hypothetical protein
MAYISKKELAEIQERRLENFREFQLELMEKTDNKFIAYKEKGKEEEHSFKVMCLGTDRTLDFEFKAGPYGYQDRFRCKNLNKFAEYTYFQGYNLIADNLKALDIIKDMDKETFDLIGLVALSNCSLMGICW